MTLPELCIRRPVLTIVFSLLILLMGAISLVQLPVREYPAVDPPTVSIVTSYPGSAAEVVQAQITEPIEAAVNTVAGIDTLTSVSREGASIVTAQFSLDTNLDVAASDVRDQLSRAARNLPVDSNPPILNKADADSAPIFGIAISSPNRSQLELGAFADTLRERLQTVPGIASVSKPAEKLYAMRLWMDPERLAAYGISPLDIRQALARENIELPAGRIEGGSVEFPVKTMSRLTSAEQFNNLVLKRVGDRTVRFRDVGYAQLGAQNERGALKMDNTPIAGLYFLQQPGANQIEIIDELRRRIELIRSDLPDDISLDIAFDNTYFVRQSLVEVTQTIFIAFILVVMVVFVFLREWRTTLIPVIAIPVSIVGAFFVMSIAGFSINTLTLLAMVLAIGLVVDDAIVVLENIYAKIEKGMSPFEAGIRGTKEIFFAVIATTISLGVVFLPLLFMGGLSGHLFREFGVTIAGAVIISSFVALSLTPMLCTRVLKPHQNHGWLFQVTEPFFQGVERNYERGLRTFLKHRSFALIILAGAIGIIYLLFTNLPKELAPMEDRGRIWVRATAPEGTSYDFMQNYMDEVAAAVRARVPEADVLMTQVPGSGGGPGVQGAVNNGFVRVFLKDRDQRQRSQQEIAEDLRSLQRDFPAARINIAQEASIGARRAAGGGIQYVLQAPDLDSLREVIPAFLDEARKSPVFTFVDSDLKFNKPEVEVNIDREKAQAMGVSTLDIAQTLQSALGGSRIGYFIFDGKQYEVIGQLTRDFRSRPEDLNNISVRSSSGELVSLNNLVTLTETSSPPELYRFNRNSAAVITGTLAQGRTMDEAISAMDAVAALTLNERFTTALSGSAKEFVDSSSSLLWVFLLALILIYLVLAAQFESFVSPFVILLTVPLALCGALLALWYFDKTLNIFSQIGLIMLIGLIAKNGILIVEFANQRYQAGVGSRLAAVEEAAVARLRPIMMTTLATVLGALPIALQLSSGAESRVSMGIAVIGGLLFGSSLTLYVIPAMYVLLHRNPSEQSLNQLEREPLPSINHSPAAASGSPL